MPGRDILQVSGASALATDESSDGWYVLLGSMKGPGVGLYVFLDDVRGKSHRALWYGASAEARDELSVVEEAGKVRWPNTQRSKRFTVPPRFDFTQPWWQRYGSEEWYYGWVHPEDPDTESAPSMALVAHIVDRLSSLLLAVGDDAIEATDLRSSPEGRLRLVTHLRRERDSRLAKHKRAEVLRTAGKLTCEACNFDFREYYGDLGDGFCEIHHLKAIAGYDEPGSTPLGQLAVVCANCHRIIHRTDPMLTPSQLRTRLRGSSTATGARRA
jgi:predicted HNH restriction endonuclease